MEHLPLSAGIRLCTGVNLRRMFYPFEWGGFIPARRATAVEPDDDLSCLRSLTLSDFEPVNVSSLMVSNDSGATSH